MKITKRLKITLHSALLALMFSLLLIGQPADAADKKTKPSLKQICAGFFKSLAKHGFGPLDVELTQKIFQENELREATSRELKALEKLHQIGSDTSKLTEEHIEKKYRGARRGELHLREDTSRALIQLGALGPTRKPKERRRLLLQRKQKATKKSSTKPKDANTEFFDQFIGPILKKGKSWPEITKLVNESLEFAEHNKDSLDWDYLSRSFLTLQPRLYSVFVFLMPAMDRWPTQKVVEAASKEGLSKHYETFLHLLLISRREKTPEALELLKRKMDWENTILTNAGADIVRVTRFAYESEARTNEQDRDLVREETLAFARLLKNSEEARVHASVLKDAVFESRELLEAFAVTRQHRYVRSWIFKISRTSADWDYAVKVLSSSIKPKSEEKSEVSGKPIVTDYFEIIEHMIRLEKKYEHIESDTEQNESFLNFLVEVPIERVPIAFQNLYFESSGVEVGLDSFLEALSTKKIYGSKKTAIVKIISEKLSEEQRVELSTETQENLEKLVLESKDSTIGALLIEALLKSSDSDLRGVDIAARSAFFRANIETIEAFACCVSQETAIGIIQKLSQNHENHQEIVKIFGRRANQEQLALYYLQNFRSWNRHASRDPLLAYFIKSNGPGLEIIRDNAYEMNLESLKNFQLAEHLEKKGIVQDRNFLAKLKVRKKEKAQKRIAKNKSASTTIQSKSRQKKQPEFESETEVSSAEQEKVRLKPLAEYSEEELSNLIKSVSFSALYARKILSALQKLERREKEAVYHFAYSMKAGTKLDELGMKSMVRSSVYHFTPVKKRNHRLILGVTKKSGLKMFFLENFKSGSEVNSYERAAKKVQKEIKAE